MRKRLLLIPAVILGLLFGVTRIAVHDVSCGSQYGPCSETVAANVTRVEGLGVLKAERALKNYLSSEGRVSDYSIRFKLPSSLQVVVIENKADVAVIREGDELYQLTSATGVALGQSRETQLPKLFIRSGKVTDNEVNFAIAILHELFRWNNLQLAVIEEDMLLVEGPEGAQFILPLSGDIDVVLGSYRLLLSWLNSGSTATRIDGAGGFRPNTVDLRFKNPVLK